MLSLLRIVELDSGKILVDGVDISTLGLEKLRSNIAVIPQDPTLYSGTIRTNLDPFNEYGDADLYEVLTRVNLFSSVGPSSSTSSLSSLSQCQVQSLSDPVKEGGNNFSGKLPNEFNYAKSQTTYRRTDFALTFSLVGQRQLLVIARALLGGAKIVILDEATAAVDSETDARIQKVLRTEFSDATCITVAHRINTIMDSDYILVMDDGRAAEFDSPSRLLSQGGLFRDLAVASSKHDK